MSGLRFGGLDSHAMHVCIDMQRLFLEPGDWFCPAGLEILPAIARLIGHAPDSSLFTRFMTPATADEAHGAWRGYYRRWHAATQAEAGPEILDLHPDLAPYGTADRLFDKTTHDAFDSAPFARHVETAAPSALVLSGVETDVCVLSTALSAVDLGIRTVIATDAVASSVAESHAACLAHIYPRYDMQIELTTVAEIVAAWNAP